ncbi:MAG: tetratricopeptide repeat protein [Planctomycetes bacterium]|nr:tetratricopeptide repeat protein [Planctomycetota bacterium]
MPAFSTGTKLAACSGFLFPGAGHVVVGRISRGVWLFAWFAFFANAAAVAPIFAALGARVSPIGCAVAAGVIWLYAALDLLRILIWRHRKALEEKKREKFLSAFGYYLRGEYSRARAKLRAVLKLDRDDPDAHFHMAMTYKRDGMPRLAKKHFRKSLVLDPWRKWQEEVKRELRDA